MDCSDAREALSAWDDSEPAAVERGPVEAHLSRCAPCRRFAASLAPLREATAATAVPSPPDLSAEVTARWRRRHESQIFALRWAVGLMGGAELANAALSLVLHGGSEAHATHESLSLTIAISLALVCAAVRPTLAAGYLPIVGTAVVLLSTTAAYDVLTGPITVLDELPHADLLVGFVVMILLARSVGPGAGADRRGRAWFPNATTRRLRLVPQRSTATGRSS